jgi:hypothetical protein
MTTATTDNTAVDTEVPHVRLAAGPTMAARGYRKFRTGGRIAATTPWVDSTGTTAGAPDLNREDPH